VDGSTANVINTVEIIDHKDDIHDVNKTLTLVVVLVILKAVKMYTISVQRRREQYHALEKVV